MQVQARPPTATGPAQWFTGDVYVAPVPQAGGPATTTSPVHSPPPPPPPWHRHTVGQTLYVTEGEGRVESRGGPVITIRPGDVIRIAGDEEHWHGAAPDRFMTHIAITEGDTNWGAHLTDDEYPPVETRS